MICDIDKFKVYNDTYGHQQGDVALKSFAETASGTLKRQGDFIARWGGEEFVVLLPGTDLIGAAEVAEQIRANVEAATVPIEEGDVTKITVSIGVNSVTPASETPTSDFIEKADQALYSAKENGRNRVVTH
jgi:diguanylate cyclase (GGDEF)-like protein